MWSKRKQIIVQKCYFPVLPGMPSYPYLTEHSRKWSNKDIKLYVGYLALFMTSEERDETCSHPPLLSCRQFLEQWVCLLYRQFLHFRRQYGGAEKTESLNHAWEACKHGDCDRAEKQNLQLTFVLNNRGAVKSGQENLSLGVLSSQTTLVGLSRRQVAICCC